MANLTAAATKAGIKVVHVDIAHGQISDGNIYDYAFEVVRAVRACHSSNVYIVVHSTGETVARLAVVEGRLAIKGMISFDGVSTGLTPAQDRLLNLIPGNNFDPTYLFLQQVQPDSVAFREIESSKPNYPTLEIRGWVGARFGTDYTWMPLSWYKTFGRVPLSVVMPPFYNDDHLQVIEDRRAIAIAINWTLYNQTLLT